MFILDNLWQSLPRPPLTEEDTELLSDRVYDYIWQRSASGGFLEAAVRAREIRGETDFYNLDVIISAGDQVKSHRGTRCCIWATQRLREYIIKDFALHGERFKEAEGRSLQAHPSSC